MSPHDFRLVLCSIVLLVVCVFLTSCQKERSPYVTSARIDYDECTVDIYQDHIMDPRGSASAYCNWLIGVTDNREVGFLTDNCQAVSGTGFYRAVVVCRCRGKITCPEVNQ